MVVNVGRDYLESFVGLRAGSDETEFDLIWKVMYSSHISFLTIATPPSKVGGALQSDATQWDGSEVINLEGAHPPDGTLLLDHGNTAPPQIPYDLGRSTDCFYL